MMSKLTMPPSIRALIYFIIFTSLVAGGMLLERYFWKGKEAKNEVQVLKADNAAVEEIDIDYRAKFKTLQDELEVLNEKLSDNTCYNTIVSDELREPKSAQSSKPINKAIRTGKPTK